MANVDGWKSGWFDGRVERGGGEVRSRVRYSCAAQGWRNGGHSAFCIVPAGADGDAMGCRVRATEAPFPRQRVHPHGHAAHSTEEEARQGGGSRAGGTYS